MHRQARRLRAMVLAVSIAVSAVGVSGAIVSADAGGAPWPKMKSAPAAAPSATTPRDAGGAPWPK